MEPIRTMSYCDGGLAVLSDDELVERVKDLASSERCASVALIRSLMEYDARRLYLREGCSSLFTYCTQVLHLSEGSAYNRIETARAARRYPRVLEAIECGDVTLTAVRLLAPHLTAANHDEMVRAARHKSKQQIQELIASLNPRPAAATILRRLALRPSKVDSTPAAIASRDTHTLQGRTSHDIVPLSSTGPAAVTPAPQTHVAVVTPLAPERYKLQVTLRRETHEKLRRAQALARHAVPDGDMGSILDRALTLLIDHLERRRFAQAASPRPNADEGTHQDATYRRLSGVQCGSATRDAARLSGVSAVATRPRSLSFTMSRRTRQEVELQRTISSSAAVLTISMRRAFSSGTR